MSNPTEPARSHWQPPTWRRALLRFAVGLWIAVWGLLLLAWLVLHWVILPRIDMWRPQIEAQASAALGVKVHIGIIDVHSSGWVPALELRDVELLDPQGRPALQLGRVAAAISPAGLLLLQLRFDQLLIEQTELEIRRDAKGRVFVAGIDLGGTANTDHSTAADWFFQQGEFVIRGGRLKWVDEQRSAPPLELTEVQLVVRNGLRHHEFRLDGTPPAAWGQRFNLRGQFKQGLLASAGDWQHWSGEAYVELPGVNVSQLRRYVALPFELSEGDGAARAWLQWDHGEARQATVDVALRAVTMRLATDIEPLGFEQVQGRLVAQRDTKGGTLSLRQFGFVTGDGVRWPASDASLTWFQREGAALTGAEFSAQRLDMQLMAQIATRIPLGKPLRELLLGLNAQGVVSGLSVRLDGPLDAPEHYSIRGRINGLWLAGMPSSQPGSIGRPGLRNADVELSATERGGQAQISVGHGALELPGVFDDAAVAVDALSTQVQWTVQPVANKAPAIVVKFKDLRVANSDLSAELSGQWSTGPGAGFGSAGRYPGRLDLTGKLLRGNAARVARYMPLGIPSDTRDYLSQAVRGGTLVRSTFRLKGDLWEFPFHNLKTAADGEFRIAAQAEDVVLAYVPDQLATPKQAAWTSPWPAFSKVSGELVIDRDVIEWRKVKASLGTLEWSGIQGGIRQSGAHGVLTVEGLGRGNLAEMLRVVAATPVAQWTGRALSQATATGRADLKLAMVIPLDNLDAAKVTGSLALGGNDIRMAPDAPLLAATRGKVEFSHQGAKLVSTTARVLGGDATLEGGSQPDGSLRFSLQGSMTADGLRRATELGAAARFAQALSGQTSYRASLGFVRGLPEFGISSNLVGLGVDLPAPLQKAPETPLSFRLQTQLVAESLETGRSPRDQVKLELGQVLNASYVRDLQGAQAKVVRGGIGVFEPAPQPSSGTALNARVAAFDADAWVAAIERLGLGGSGTEADALGYGPQSLTLNVGQLTLAQRKLNRVVAGLTLTDNTWRVTVNAEQLAGYAEYRQSRSGSAGRVYARLSRLNLPRTEAESVESLLDQQPASVPALDIVVENFVLRDRPLGRIEIEAVNRTEAGVREWRLNKFKLSVPEAQLNATGSWAAVPGGGRRRASMDFRLELADSGALLDRLGMGEAIKGGKGALAGRITWLGSPLSLDIPTLVGEMNVAVASGQFLKAEPGAARLLGVLSLQSLPRRLLLDFRDVFLEGFAFDNLTGDVKVANGVATTTNLRMRGVQAVVAMEGQANLTHETQDLRVVVVPEINAGTASLAYSLINPVLGLGTFLAQLFLRAPLIEANTQEFHVVGSWADPKVERVERQPKPVPNAASATSAASGAP